MKFVCGKDDKAGRNIAEFLENNFGKKVIFVEKHPVFMDYLENEIGAEKGETIIMLSKHQSEKKIRSLTVHPAGNFDTNDLGGLKFKMSPYDARLSRSILSNIKNYAINLDYEVTYEATHHGPISENPLIFVEIGSTDIEYEDKDAGLVIARALSEASPEADDVKCGIGGPHYSRRFTSLATNDGIAIGHIASKYRFASINEGLLREMYVKSIGCSGFIVEAGSFNSLQKKALTDKLDLTGYSYNFI
jgi:D-aminoacyl-tRNA deacylase